MIPTKYGGGLNKNTHVNPVNVSASIPENLVVQSIQVFLCRLISLAAKSFYNLQIQYTLEILEYTPKPDPEEPYFEIDATTGDLIALKQLAYTVDPHRYVVNVTAIEQVSGFTTTQQVCSDAFGATPITMTAWLSSFLREKAINCYN